MDDDDPEVRRAIALSLGLDPDADQATQTAGQPVSSAGHAQEAGSEQNQGSITVDENMDEEEMMRRAIAASLESSEPKLEEAAGDSGAQMMETDVEEVPYFSKKADGDVFVPGMQRLKEKSHCIAVSAPEPLHSEVSAQIEKLIWGKNPVPDDQKRWNEQGFQFPSNETLRMGFTQRSGGPCGVLAPVCGFVLRFLMFDWVDLTKDQAFGSNQPPAAKFQFDEASTSTSPFAPDSLVVRLSLESARNALIDALVFILYRCSANSSYVVVSCVDDSPSSNFVCQTASSIDDVKCIFFIHASSDASSSSGEKPDDGSTESKFTAGKLSWPRAVLAFLYSVILTRGIDTIKGELDDIEMSLIGRFGHCGQEILNLMLVGRAVSNVFDGTMNQAGMLLHGIPNAKCIDIPVGYLSELEAMRYITVGQRYKYPTCPIWVIGSPTHYTVLFAHDSNLAAQSEQEKLAKTARKAFDLHALDVESGMAMPENLDKIFATFRVSYPDRMTDSVVQAGKQRFASESVVLWNDFHNWCRARLDLDKREEIDTSAFVLFHYDGQKPTTLRRLRVNQVDADSQFVQADMDVFSPALQTRWKNAMVSIVSTVSS
jgi:hypothetical protein